MTKYLIEEATLTKIADAIRVICGSVEAIKTSDMADMIKIVLQEKAITPSTTQQIITADEGYNGLSKVTVKGDANLVADNIKSGVSIFDVAGSYEGSGGGTGGTGGSLDTCTVIFSGNKVPSSGALLFCYQTIENDQVVTKTSYTGVTSPVTVLCGSMIVITDGYAGQMIQNYTTVSSGITLCFNNMLYGGMIQAGVFQINLSAGETGTITMNSTGFD